jgi:hypothetical protein
LFPNSIDQLKQLVVDNGIASKHVSSYIIEIPVKRWRPKQTTNYHPVDDDCLPDEFFIHHELGKAIIDDGIDDLPPRDDIIVWNEEQHASFVLEHLRVGSTCTTEIRDAIINIIKQYWDAFDPKGVRRPVRGVLFHIDTGNAQPICVPQPNYGLHERKIMQAAPKPHQENCDDIQNFIWRMCVNYQPLNKITYAFRFMVGRCSDMLQLFNDSRGLLFAISVDADSGFHQIGVSEEARDKLAFWGPTGKLSWNVMPFGITSGPSFFQFLMSKIIRFTDKLIAEGVSRNEAYRRAMYVIKNIIDDLLLVSDDQQFLLFVFQCVCAAFVHFRLTGLRMAMYQLSLSLI